MKSGAVFFGVAIVLLASIFYLAKPHATRWKTPNDLIGKPAPDFTLTDLNGNSVQLSSLRGKAVVVNFWASWCGPCKEETPWLVELQKQYGPAGLQIVGIALDDSGHGAVADFAQEMRINYPVMIGNDSVADSYGGVQSLPTTFYIGRNGQVANSVLGVIDKAHIEQNITRALQQP